MADNTSKTARNEMLSRVRDRLGVRGDEPGRRGLVQSRLRNPHANLIPERAQKPRPELVKLFQTMLEKSGAKFGSETDTEVVAHLVTREMKKGRTPVEAVAAALPRLRGAFALASPSAFESFSTCISPTPS